jgi:hypothetical protein
MEINMKFLIGFILGILLVAAYEAHGQDTIPIPHHVLKALNFHVLPPVCVVSISLTDSLRKQYCFICKDDSGRVKIKLSRLVLTEKELKEINSWVDKTK